MTLKTLKNIRANKPNVRPKYIRDMVCDELKAEAIKRVKKKNEAFENVWRFGNMNIDDWFDFFNITEKDLIDIDADKCVSKTTGLGRSYGYDKQSKSEPSK